MQSRFEKSVRAFEKATHGSTTYIPSRDTDMCKVKSGELPTLVLAPGLVSPSPVYKVLI